MSVSDDLKILFSVAKQSGNADCWDGDKRSISDISLLLRQRSFHDSHKWQSSSLLELPCNIEPVPNVSGTTASMVLCASTSITGAKCVFPKLGEGYNKFAQPKEVYQNYCSSSKAPQNRHKWQRMGGRGVPLPSIYGLASVMLFDSSLCRWVHDDAATYNASKRKQRGFRQKGVGLITTLLAKMFEKLQFI